MFAVRYITYIKWGGVDTDEIGDEHSFEENYFLLFFLSKHLRKVFRYGN